MSTWQLAGDTMVPLRPGRAQQLLGNGLALDHTQNTNPDRAVSVPRHRHTECEQMASPSIHHAAVVSEMTGPHRLREKLAENSWEKLLVIRDNKLSM